MSYNHMDWLWYDKAHQMWCLDKDKGGQIASNSIFLQSQVRTRLKEMIKMESIQKIKKLDYRILESMKAFGFEKYWHHIYSGIVLK